MTASVLAIDDSRTIRTLLSEALKAHDFNVTTAVDGVDGLEKFKESPPAVVITDINMPNLDGFGVIEGIRQGGISKTVPIIVLSTECGPELKSRARQAGATGWIVKPFDETALVSVIRRVAGA